MGCIDIHNAASIEKALGQNSRDFLVISQLLPYFIKVPYILSLLKCANSFQSIACPSSYVQSLVDPNSRVPQSVIGEPGIVVVDTLLIYYSI